jgi:hypothetical protein
MRFDFLILAYMTAVQMAEDAQWEGRMYGSLYSADLTGLDLEWEFSLISKELLKRDLYNGHAFLFDCFAASQKRLLFYLLSRMSREHLRRKRRFSCEWKVTNKEISHVLKRRFPGTYRVEKDPAVVCGGSDRPSLV